MGQNTSKDTRTPLLVDVKPYKNIHVIYKMLCTILHLILQFGETKEPAHLQTTLVLMQKDILKLMVVVTLNSDQFYTLARNIFSSESNISNSYT